MKEVRICTTCSKVEAELLSFRPIVSSRFEFIPSASNAFTAYQKTCFHFSCPESAFPEALQRFAALFVQQDVEKICRDSETLQREIRRVDAELNFDDASSQAFYLTKSFVNLEHPFAKFSAGSLETLETKPNQQGIDVSNRLIEFFRKLYLPNEAILVLVGRQDFFALERMAAPFSITLSRTKPSSDRSLAARELPGAFLQGNRYKHLVLYRKNDDEKTEDISFQWTTNFDYRDKAPTITATNVAFILAQILARKGPGSLYQFLQRRGWVPNDPSGIPRVSVPVEVSRFQIIKMAIRLTQDGFINRSSVASAVYDSFDCLRRGGSYVIPRDLLRQYATIAKLHAFSLTPRAPDAVELAMDAQLYGFRSSVGTGRWYRFPEDRSEISALQRAVSETFAFMADPNNALIIATAGGRTLAKMEERNSGNNNIVTAPSFSSPSWLTEPITGGRFFFDDMLKYPSRIEQLVLKRAVNRDELYGPVINPLVPSFLRPPRIVQEVTAGRVNVNELLLFRTASEESNEDRVLRMSSSNKQSQESAGPRWQILEPSYPGQSGLPIPRGPPESSCRCAFAFELISSRPVRANVRQAAQAELWKISFEAAAKDLVEYGGAPGGLSYEISFNNFGMRVAILGISQTLPSYTRRLARRLAEHSFELLQGPQYFPPAVTSAAIYRAERARWSSQRRKRTFISNLRRSTAYEAATEGIAFFRSCYGAVCFAQGDLLRFEILELMQDLQTILEPAFSKDNRGETSSALPGIEDLLYKPVWKPSFSCAIAGMNLLSDACGRIPR